MADKKEARITVDPDLFRQGLKAAYEGISLIYKSLGLSSVHGLKNEKSGTGLSLPVVKESDQKPASSDASLNAADQDPIADKPERAIGNATAPEKKASSLTQDDVTKIIVMKIKQDRSNNEKIGHILKTYGVAKVGELPPAKYEAFVTDIAAL